MHNEGKSLRRLLYMRLGTDSAGNLKVSDTCKKIAKSVWTGI